MIVDQQKLVIHYLNLIYQVTRLKIAFFYFQTIILNMISINQNFDYLLFIDFNNHLKQFIISIKFKIYYFIHFYIIDMGFPDLIGRYVFIILGFAFYFITINQLLQARQEKAQKTYFFNIIDRNEDGVITQTELSKFEPCDDFSQDNKLMNRMTSMGKKITKKQAMNQFSSKLIKTGLSKCANKAEFFSNPIFLSQKSAKKISDDYFYLYDLNRNKQITWTEYILVNGANKKSNQNAREAFKFFDKNRDWKISFKEFNKAKLNQMLSKSRAKSKGGKRH